MNICAIDTKFEIVQYKANAPLYVAQKYKDIKGKILFMIFIVFCEGSSAVFFFDFAAASAIAFFCFLFIR